MVTRAMLAVGIGALAAGAGCTLLLGGNVDYHEVDAGVGGATGSSTAASSTASGAASTTASSAAGSGSGGSGGGPACRLLPNTMDCGVGKRCTVVDQLKGTPGCVPLSTVPRKPFGTCANDDTLCPAGTWCDSFSRGVCKPFCATSADCVDGGECVANPAGNGGQLIPGLSVCTANCDPVALSPCANGATCLFLNGAEGFDCAESQDVTVGGACPQSASSAACAPTLACVSDTCLPWCHPAGSSSPDCAGNVCTAFAGSSPMYNGKVYGFCM